MTEFLANRHSSHAVSVTNHDIAYKLRQAPPFCRSAEVNRFEKHGGWPAYSLGEFLYKEFNFMFLKNKDADGKLKVHTEFIEETVNIFTRHIEIIENEIPRLESYKIDSEHRGLR